MLMLAEGTGRWAVSQKPKLIPIYYLLTCVVKTKGILTIYIGKPEIPVGKSNGSRHSAWEASVNMGCDLRRWNICCSF